MEDNTELIAAQQELTDNLAALEIGNVQFLRLEELENDLEATIRKHEA